MCGVCNEQQLQVVWKVVSRYLQPCLEMFNMVRGALLSVVIASHQCLFGQDTNLHMPQELFWVKHVADCRVCYPLGCGMDARACY